MTHTPHCELHYYAPLLVNVMHPENIKGYITKVFWCIKVMFTP